MIRKDIVCEVWIGLNWLNIVTRFFETVIQLNN